MRDQWFMFAPDESGGSGENNDDESGNTDESAQGGTGEGSGDSSELVPRSELAKVNAEAAKRREENNKLKARIAELEGHSKTEVEKERDRATTAEKDRERIAQENRTLRATVIAERVGIAPDAREDAARLLNWETITDPDDPTEVEIALRNLVKDKKYLLGGHRDADGGRGGTRDAEKVDMNSLIRGAAGLQ